MLGFCGKNAILLIERENKVKKHLKKGVRGIKC